MLRRYALLGAAVGVLAVLVVAGCGSSPSTGSGGGATTSGGATAPATTSGSATAPATTSGGPTAPATTSTSFAATKFAFHAGLAFGAFHQFIYKPIKAGTIGNPLTLLKVVPAGLFTYHEAKLAYHDAQSSQTLKALVAPFTVVIDKVKTLYAKLKGGQVPSSGDVLTIQSDVNNISSLATASGTPIKEITPTAAQLAAGVAH